MSTRGPRRSQSSSGSSLLREFGTEGSVMAGVLALSRGQPHLRPPLQFATSVEERLLLLVSADELEALREEQEAELQGPGRWGATFTLVPCRGRRG
jgi:hypothetical protein